TAVPPLPDVSIEACGSVGELDTNARVAACVPSSVGAYVSASVALGPPLVTVPLHESGVHVQPLVHVRSNGAAGRWSVNSSCVEPSETLSTCTARLAVVPTWMRPKSGPGEATTRRASGRTPSQRTSTGAAWMLASLVSRSVSFLQPDEVGMQRTANCAAAPGTTVIGKGPGGVIS